MKLKFNFVTNSSTSCFIAFGIETEIEDIIDNHRDAIFDYYIKQCSKLGFTPDSKEELFSGGSEEWESIRDWIDTVHLDSAIMVNSSWIMIGKSPFKMKEDQTIREFKFEIAESFKELGFNIGPDDLNQIENAWEDR